MQREAAGMIEQKRLCACAPPLISWYLENGRDLPWRQTNDPYSILVSEIMLQQTRVEAVKGYYTRFLHVFPTAEALANAPEERVLKLWEGLGYYSRARNLQRAAQIIAEHGFPQTYDDLRTLPGVGPYTAAAVASTCFSLPCPAVDGNVLRLCSRLLCDQSPLGDAMKKRYTALLRPAYEKNNPRLLTQALMELGATLCGPNGSPSCHACPLLTLCLAQKQGIADKLPIRPIKKARRQEQRTVFLLRCGDAIAVQKRPAHGLLSGMWELPNISGFLSESAAAEQASVWGVKPINLLSAVSRTHIFTHVEWDMRGIAFSCAQKHPAFLWATPEDLRDHLALPTAFRQFI